MTAHSTHILVAGSAFDAIGAHLEHELPASTVEMANPESIRDSGREAEVLIPTMSRIDGELMDRVAGLRLIQQWGGGIEGVDIAAASERGIYVANVPTEGSGNAESVAEWCVMAAIAVGRQLPHLAQAIRSGSGWGGPVGRVLKGRTAGIVGLGGIGQALAARLKPFQMRLLGLKRRPDAALAERLGLDWLGGMDALPELLEQSDYLFLCLPLTDETRGLIDRKALRLLPQGAAVVNPGRGGLLSQAALIDAIASGRLIGAGLDVFENEPLEPNDPILQRTEILATPHIAGVTDLSYSGVASVVAANIRRIHAGETPVNCFNVKAVTQKPKNRQ